MGRDKISISQPPVLAQVDLRGRKDAARRDSASVTLGDERETLGGREIHAGPRALATLLAPPREHGTPSRRRG